MPRCPSLNTNTRSGRCSATAVATSNAVIAKQPSPQIAATVRAQTALVRARSDVLAARYDQYVGYANVLLAAGRLKDVGAFGS
jgi:hypothetical protein